MFLWPKFLRNKELGYKAIPQTLSEIKPTEKLVNVRIESFKHFNSNNSIAEARFVLKKFQGNPKQTLRGNMPGKNSQTEQTQGRNNRNTALGSRFPP